MFLAGLGALTFEIIALLVSMEMYVQQKVWLKQSSWLKRMLLRSVLLLSFTVLYVLAVDRSNFKTCSQSGFCKRQRSTAQRPEYEVVPETVMRNASAVIAELRSRINTLRMVIVSLADSTIRVVIDEPEGSLRPRYQPLDVLQNGTNLKTEDFKYFKKEASMVTFVLENGAQVMVAFKPFQILVYINGEVVVGLNSHHLLKFEHYRKKVPGKEKDDGEGFWEETFKTHTDSKPH
ncbi:unnamed protein product, partial [Enterobius vermicularis]|uniref:Galectin n=1 Tax=Enterobius vermicularis TaxID=51028 RepID=A0A0N4VLP4_ENTVE